MVPTKSMTLTHSPIGILTGPTATGKSTLAIQLANRFQKIEIINADSLLVYKYFNIGTAKPTPEERLQAPHHLIDILDPDVTFTAGDFKRAAETAISEIQSRGNRPLIVGGTGFYLQSLLFGSWEAPPASPELRDQLGLLENQELFHQLSGKDPESAQRIGISDRYRLIRALELITLSGNTPTELQKKLPTLADPRFHLWVIDRSNSELHSRIEERTQKMLDQNWIDEVRQIQVQFPNCRSLNSVGYRQVCNYLDGKIPIGRKLRLGLPGLRDEIELATRQLVKKQRTWFKNQSHRVLQSRWFQLEDEVSLLEKSMQALYQT